MTSITNVDIYYKIEKIHLSETGLWCSTLCHYFSTLTLNTVIPVPLIPIPIHLPINVLGMTTDSDKGV